MRCFQAHPAHPTPPARRCTCVLSAAPHQQPCTPHRPQLYVRPYVQPSVAGARELKHSHEHAGGEGPRTDTAHRAPSLAHWQQLWQRAPAQQHQQVSSGEQLQKPLHPEQQQQQQQQASQHTPRFFRHEASWRPLPPNQQEAACVEQQQELSAAIQATEDLPSLQNLLHSYIGHPVLDAVHIALALTQVRRLVGADSSYALASSWPVPHASSAWAPSNSSLGSSTGAGMKHGHAPSARGWAHAHAQGAGGAVLLPSEGRGALKRGRRQKEAQEMQVAKTVDLILDASLPLIPSFGTVEVTASLHALARLQVHTASSWSDTFLEHARSLMPRYTLQQLSTLAWSLGSLGLDPGPQWLDDLCLAAAALLESLTDRQSSSNDTRGVESSKSDSSSSTSSGSSSTSSSSSSGGWGGSANIMVSATSASSGSGGKRESIGNGVHGVEGGLKAGEGRHTQETEVCEGRLASAMEDWEDSLDSLWGHSERDEGDTQHNTSTGEPCTSYRLDGSGSTHRESHTWNALHTRSAAESSGTHAFLRSPNGNAGSARLHSEQLSSWAPSQEDASLHLKSWVPSQEDSHGLSELNGSQPQLQPSHSDLGRGLQPQPPAASQPLHYGGISQAPSSWAFAHDSRSGFGRGQQAQPPAASQPLHYGGTSQAAPLPSLHQRMSERLQPSTLMHDSTRLLMASTPSQGLPTNTPFADLDSRLHSGHTSDQHTAEAAQSQYHACANSPPSGEAAQFQDHPRTLIPASEIGGSSHGSLGYLAGGTTGMTHDLQLTNGSGVSESSLSLHESTTTNATTNTSSISGISIYPQDNSSRSSSIGSSVRPSDSWDSSSSSFGVDGVDSRGGGRDTVQSSNGVPPFHLVNMAWGLARLQHNVPEAWTHAYNEALRLNWHQLRPHALSNAAWAAAVLGLSSEPAHTQAYCEACTLKMHRANAYDLSMILWSLALRSVRPSNQWMEQFLGAMLRALPTAEPRHVARVMWALAKLKWRPSPSWAARVFQQTELQAFEFDGQAFSITLWSVSSLGLKPPIEWLETMLVAAFEGGLSDYGPQELTNLLESLGRLRFAPEYAWMDLFWAVSYQKLSRFRPEELASILSAAVKVGHQPPPQWLSVYLKVVGRVMLHALSLPASTAGGAACSLRGLAKQQPMRGDGEDGMTTLPLHGFARILASLAALEVNPSQRWMAAFFEVTKHQLHSLRGAMSNTASAEEQQQQQQQGDMEPGLVQCSSSSSSSTSTSGSSSSAGSLTHAYASGSKPHSRVPAPAASSTASPPAAFAERVGAHSAGRAMAAANAGLGMADPHEGPATFAEQGGALAAGRAEAAAHEGPEVVAAGAQPAAFAEIGAAHSGPTKAAAHEGLGVAGAHERPGTGAAGPAHRVAGGKLGAVFESLLTGLAALGVQPPEDWLDAFFDASFPYLSSMRQRNLDGLAYAVASLQLCPSPDWSQALVDAIECRLTQAQARGEKVNRTSLGRCLLGIRYLQGPSSPVYQRWKDADWIGPALELYAYDTRGPQQRSVPQSSLARGVRARRPVRPKHSLQGHARQAVE